MSALPEIVRRMAEHPDAPRWTTRASDRLLPADLEALEALRSRLASGRRGWDGGLPRPAILRRVAGWSGTVPWLRRHLASGFDLEKNWVSVPTTSRIDVATTPWDLMPDDAELDRLIVYRTAGTTGHPLLVPHHPLAAASYLPLLEVALSRHRVMLDLGADTVACMLLGAQAHTVTYPCALQAWGGAGFAKLNLRQTEWPSAGSQGRFLGELAPQLLTGDPISFAEMLRLGIATRPRALVTTAVAMSSGLRGRLAEACRCPVIDWYSLTETGPVGYACTTGSGYHVVADDLHVEALGPDGAAVHEGERGEITLTGGRNPFLPLLRYRTGDWGRLAFGPCSCGDPMPRIEDLEGRVPVLFRTADGAPANPVDLARALRELPLVQHVMSQHRDGAVELVVRLLPGHPVEETELVDAVRSVLGQVPVTVNLDATLGDRHEGKLEAWKSDLLLED